MNRIKGEEVVACSSRSGSRCSSSRLSLKGNCKERKVLQAPHAWSKYPSAAAAAAAATVFTSLSRRWKMRLRKKRRKDKKVEDPERHRKSQRAALRTTYSIVRNFAGARGHVLA